MRLDEILQSVPPKRAKRIESESGMKAERLALLRAGAAPLPSEVVAIAKALRMHPSTLVGTNYSDTTAKFLFRSLDNASAEDGIALRRMSERLSATAELLEGLGSFDNWLTEFLRGDTTSGEEASRNAALFRRRFANGDMLGPLSQLPQLCVEKLQLALFTMDDLPFDGSSAIYEHIPVVFLSRRFVPRMLFSLAHELGHLIAHHFSNGDAVGAGGNFISVDREVRVTVARKRKAEQYAHAFASELLMPRQSVGLFFKALRRRQSVPADGIGDLEILVLSRYYNVSFGVAAMRCEQLTLIPAGGARALTSRISSRRESAEKKAKAMGMRPRAEASFPSIAPFLVKAAAAKISDGRLSVGRASELLGLSVGNLIDLHSGGGHPVAM